MRALAVSAIALALVTTAGSAAPVTLCDGGQAQVVIATGPEPSETVQLAAAELVEYLGKMSGAEVEVVEAQEAGRPAVLLGAAAVGDRADLSALGPEGRLLRTLDDGSVIVAGRTDGGTLNAAYDLLHLLGVRWFMPGEVGEHVPRLDPLIVPEIAEVFEPSMSYRRIWSAANRLRAQQRDEYGAWQRRSHMPGWFNGSMGHAYAAICDPRERGPFKEHPEYFSLIDGVRVARSQICTTNADVRERAVQYAIDYFTANPENFMVSMSPNDGYNWCECENCRAEGSMSDNALALANHVAAALQEQMPGKYVAMYAYGPTSPLPSIDAHENVIIWIATAFIRGGFTLPELIEGWSARCQQIGIRTYYSVCPWSWEMPHYGPEETAANLRYWHMNKARGVSAESEDNFGSRGPRYYIGSRLMYDIEQDVGDLLHDYYANCWGAAAPAMRRYWERWEGGRPVTGERLALALRDLQEADGPAQTDEVRRRIMVMKAYLHYLRLFREYGSASAEEKTAALGRCMSYGYAMQPFHMVHIPNVFFRIVGKPNARKLDIPEETLAAWTATEAMDPFAPETAARVEADFQQDLQDYQPLAVERVEYSEDLGPLGEDLEGAAGGPSYRGANRAYVVAPEDGVIRLAVTTGLVRERECILALEELDGGDITTVEVPPGVTQEIPVDTGREDPDTLAMAGEGQLTELDAGRPGPVRLRIEPQGGSAARIDFGALAQAAVASEESPLSFIGGTRGPVYFYVPAGVPRFAVSIRTPDAHGRLRIFPPDGEMVLEVAGDYRMGEDFLVEVPNGTAGRVWSLTVDKCEDCTLSLIGVPPLVSQRPTAVLVPQEALGR